MNAFAGFEVFGRIRDGGPFHEQLASGESQSLEDANVMRALWSNGRARHGRNIRRCRPDLVCGREPQMVQDDECGENKSYCSEHSIYPEGRQLGCAY